MSHAVQEVEPIFGSEDEAIDRALDVENFNRRSAYNFSGYWPVRDELRHAPVSVISGRIPKDLEGVYLRNGTNTQFDKSYMRLHAFSGAGMLHQIQIRGGKATYSNTYIRTPRFVAEDAAGREIYSGIADVTGGGRASLERLGRIEQKKAQGLVPNLGNLEASPG